MHHRAWMHKDGQGGPIDYPAAAKLYYNAFILGQKEVLNPLIKLADDGKMDACFYLTLIGLLSEDQTGKNRAISLVKKFPLEIRERLYDEILRRMSEEDASEVWIRETLDFVDQHVNQVKNLYSGAKRHYIDFKVLIMQEKISEALTFYYDKLPPDQVLTSQELFLLGTAQLALSDLAEDGLQKNKLRHQALRFFYQGKNLGDEGCRTVLFRLHEKNFLEEVDQQEMIRRVELTFSDDEQRQELRQQIKCIKNFITIVTLQSRHASSITTFFKALSPDKSVIFAHRLLAGLESDVRKSQT